MMKTPNDDDDGDDGADDDSDDGGAEEKLLERNRSQLISLSLPMLCTSYCTSLVAVYFNHPP